MRIAGIDKQSVVNAPGVNYTIWLQGCSHHCKDCFNLSTWDYNGGYELDLNEIYDDIAYEVEKSTINGIPLITGVTFSGGEPLDQMLDVVSLACLIKTRLGLTTNLYTGYTLKYSEQFNWYSFSDDSSEDHDRESIMFPKHLKYIDNIFDGRFDIDKRSYNTPFRGSHNQRWLKRGEDYLVGGE
jgi:anaerobic ribonucleoside-triphosphate reductase activating protein